MKQICISPTAQRLMVLGTVTAIGFAVAAEVPEIKRYLKIRSM
jgi:hypothetical protein